MCALGPCSIRLDMNMNFYIYAEYEMAKDGILSSPYPLRNSSLSNLIEDNWNYYLGLQKSGHVLKKGGSYYIWDDCIWSETYPNFS